MYRLELAVESCAIEKWKSRGAGTEDDKRMGGRSDRRDEVEVVEVVGAAKMSFILVIKLFCMPEKEKRHLNVIAKGKKKG